MATKWRTKRGKEILLLTPNEKAYKYSREMKENKRADNYGKFKTDDDGCFIPLTPEARAFRAGYLERGREEHAIYCKKHGIKSKSTFKRGRRK